MTTVDETGQARVVVDIRHRHSLAVRWLHWLNFALLLIMTWSGLLIYWANSVHELRVLGFTFRFFPPGFYQALNVPYRLATGLQYHLTFAWVFSFNGLLYIGYLAMSGKWRRLVPQRRDRTSQETGGYSTSQRIAYSTIVLTGLLAILSGVAIAKSARFGFLTAAFGGYRTAKLIHFILALIFVGFLVVHVIQVVRAGWNTFRSMIVGREKVTRVIRSAADVAPSDKRSGEVLS